jgi:hypothetical protein
MPNGSCPAGEACQFGACVRLEGEAVVPGLGSSLGATADRIEFPSDDTFIVSILEGAACHSLPASAVGIVSLEFLEDFPTNQTIEMGGAYFMSASYRAESAVGNELATSLSLRLTRFDLDAGGVVEGEFDATFPSAMLTGTFSASRCAPL